MVNDSDISSCFFFFREFICAALDKNIADWTRKGSSVLRLSHRNCRSDRRYNVLTVIVLEILAANGVYLRHAVALGESITVSTFAGAGR